MPHKRPTIGELVEIVRNHHKTVGLRMVYKRFFVPYHMRPQYREMWDLIAKELEDAAKDGDKQEGREQQHIGTGKKREAARSGSGDRDGQGRKESATKKSTKKKVKKKTKKKQPSVPATE